MNENNALPSLPHLGACALPHLGVLRATGPDAASFLHNQLTQDFLLLKPEQARLAAFCNAKGRMQASMIGLKTGPEDVLLVLRQDLLAQTLKRLSMFVLRAKVKLSDASAEMAVWGVFQAAGDVPWTCQPVHDASAPDSIPAWAVSLYPAAGVSRRLIIGSMPSAMPSAMPSHLPALALENWLLGEVLSGIADVQAATFEAFVPQMLNYESVDGVNFKKGCYPGQEVVARSQFRGTLKRRTYLVSCDAALAPGQEVFKLAAPADAPDNSHEPVGVVAQAARHATQGHWALVCLQTSAAEAGGLHTGSGQALQLHPLPYTLRDDI